MKVTITHMSRFKSARRGQTFDGVAVYARHAQYRFVVYYHFVEANCTLDLDLSELEKLTEISIVWIIGVCTKDYGRPYGAEIHCSIHIDHHTGKPVVRYESSSLTKKPEKLDHFRPEILKPGLEEC